jgi:hypothetical protein
MAVEVIQNPVTIIADMIIFLVCLTAITFIGIVLLCGLRPQDLLGVEEE